jgi:Domain of unknown function (DUF4399)
MLIRAMTVAGLALVAACGQDATPEAGSPAAAPAPAAPAALERRPAPAGAMVYFIEPADGATVTSPFRVVFGLKGAGIAPAGVEREGTGHHHLLIDTDLPDLNQPIPSDANHRHFGGGQTEVELELSPGTHTLQLLLGDERHLPHDPPIMSDRITIQVR